jgi:DUF2946 family protein
MIDLRRWICLVAAVGMLAHAIAVVRHNGAMLSALAAPPGLTTDLALICHGADAVGPAAGGLPSPAKDAANCPICSGLGPAFLAAPLVRANLWAWLAATLAPPLAAHSPPLPRLALRPPVRGPPALA